jgi:hypothetical protein
MGAERLGDLAGKEVVVAPAECLRARDVEHLLAASVDEEEAAVEVLQV